MILTGRVHWWPVPERPPPRAYLQLLLGLVLAFQGLALAIISNKLIATFWWMRLVGIAMALGGMYYLYRYLPREVLTIPMSEAAKARAAHDLVKRLSKGEEERTLAERFIDRLTLSGRLTPYLPLIGVAIIAADLAWNLVLTGSREFMTYDWLALLTGGFLIAYNYIPKDYERERAFAFVFLFALALMLIVPILVERAGEGNPSSQAGISAYSEYLLVKPLDGMLRLSGIWSLTDGVNITFETTYRTSDGDDQMKVLIATSCSGVYSFAIFVAAFLAFVATEFKQWDSRLKWFLAIGILAAYVANLLRMYIIVLMGHFYSEEAFRETHANAGWLIYMAWIALFWWLLFRWFFKQQEREGLARERPQAAE